MRLCANARSLSFFIMTDTEKRYLTKIDEINKVFYQPTETYSSVESLLQAVHDYLLDMYLEGFAATGYLLKDKERQADYDTIEDLLLLNIDGKTLYDRIEEYYGVGAEKETPETENTVITATENETEANKGKIKDGAVYILPAVAIAKVIETEAHRMYNNGSRDRALKAGAKYKKWMTMGDDRVRDTHDYIAGERIPIDERFYTYDGDSALMPGGFDAAENNVNCRCWLNYGY